MNDLGSTVDKLGLGGLASCGGLIADAGQSNTGQRVDNPHAILRTVADIWDIHSTRYGIASTPWGWDCIRYCAGSRTITDVPPGAGSHAQLESV